MNSPIVKSSQINGASTGRSFSVVNFRGLGGNQTLILVNGRRTIGGLGDFQFDLNALSPTMIERIEVLPSSASAIYGGNAVGGVLNVILKRDFTGGDFALSYDTPLDAHAPVRSVSGSYAWSFQEGRTHLTLSGSLRDTKPITVSDRLKLYRRGFDQIADRAPGILYSPSNPSSFGTTPNISSADGSPLVFRDGTPLAGISLGSSLTYIPAGTSPTTSLADLQAGLLANAGQQNLALAPNSFGLFSPFDAQGETLSVDASLRHKVTERVELIGEASWNRNQGSAWWPGGFPRGTVPAGAPNNPFAQEIRIRVPNPDNSGSWQQQDVRVTMRGVVGFVADLPRDWRLQGDTTWTRSTKGETSGRRFDLASGRTAYPAALATGALNPFVDTLAFPLDLAPFATADSLQRQTFGLMSVMDTNLRASGAIGTLPAGPVNLTLGLGYRKEKYPGNNYDGGPVVGRSAYYSQSQRVQSLYAEGWVPLIAPLNDVPAVRSLDVQVAHRLEKYAVSANANSYRLTFPPDYDEDFGEQFESTLTRYTANNSTVGLRYKPVDAFTLRASYATGFFPPPFADLQVAPISPIPQETSITDPLRGNEQVIARFLSGGSPDLKPMDSRSINVGFIFEPTLPALQGLHLGVEWFRINRENLIFSPGGQFLVSNSARYPDRVLRADPAPGDPYGIGPIEFINTTSLNANRTSTEGFDITLGFQKPTARHGLFTFDAQATFVDSFTRVLGPGDPEQEVVGQAYFLGPGPLELRANATMAWERGPWSLSWTTLYYSSYDAVSAEDWGQIYADAQGATTIPHQIYHNLLAAYRFPESPQFSGRGMLSNLTITLGMRNVFNTFPPFDVTTDIGTRGWYSHHGDPRLRSVQVSVHKRFK